MANHTKRGTLVAALLTGGLAITACGSPAPEVSGADLRSDQGQVPTAVGAQTANPPPATAGSPAPVTSFDGEYPIRAGEAGTVVVVVSGRQITLRDVQLEPGWRQIGLDQDFDEVSVTFAGDSRVTKVDAEVDDGRFDTDVEVESPAIDGRFSYPMGDAGVASVDVTGGFVALAGVEAATGWVATVDERELADGEVQIDVRNDAASQTVEFDAEVDDGRMKVHVDTRTGPMHFVDRGPGR